MDAILKQFTPESTRSSDRVADGVMGASPPTMDWFRRRSNADMSSFTCRHVLYLQTCPRLQRAASWSTWSRVSWNALSFSRNGESRIHQARDGCAEYPQR
jgi:hypothetical protein